MSAQNPNKVRGSSSKPLTKKTTSAKAKKSSGRANNKVGKREQVKEISWWQAAKRDRIIILLTVLALLSQVYSLFASMSPKVEPVRTTTVNQTGQNNSVIVNNIYIQPVSDKR